MSRTKKRSDVEADAAKKSEQKETLAAASSIPERTKRSDHTVFITKHKEHATYTIRAGGKVINGLRDPSGQYIIFRVPNESVETFKNHQFVKTGRLVQAE